MVLVKWNELPEELRKDAVRPYYDILQKKRFSLRCKRIFDIVGSTILMIVLFPIFIIISVIIRLDSKGSVIFRQERVTQYGKKFVIYKFRTMVVNADKCGAKVTTDGDTRITKIGAFLRKYRLDEICQLMNIFCGTMTFVGTRPEVREYVSQYTDEMMATLLLPAGLTSECSIFYKNEEHLLTAGDADDIYINKILPEKMKINLSALREFGFWTDIKIIFMTIFTMFGLYKTNK